MILRSNLTCLSKMCYFKFFSINLMNLFPITTSVRIFVVPIMMTIYLTYLFLKCLCKDSIDKMHKVLFLDIFFDAWTR